MKEHESVEKYLEEVSNYLESIADRDQIISELRTHIWELANQISSKNPNLTIQAAFAQAVLRMEDPQTLASKFLEEESTDFITDWKAPVTIPEKKVQNEQFLVLAIVGFASVLVMSWIIQIVSQNIVVTIISIFLGILAASLFVLGLYLSDEKLFREQIARFRELLHKPSSDQKIATKSEDRATFVQAETGYREVGFWSAFGEHLGGLLGGIFFGFVIAFIFILDSTNILPLFNENWNIIGRLAIYSALGTSLAYSASLVIFGRIRVTRLLSAAQNVVGLICAVILVLYYPFTLELAILALNIPEVMSNSDLLSVVSNADLILQVIIGISGVISGISALYDTFKFGAWKPSDRKSLI